MKHWLLFASGAWIVVSLFVTALDWQGRWYTEGSELWYFIKLWLFWAQFSVWPLLFWVVNLARNAKGKARFVFLTLAAPLLIGIWAGQVEPFLLLERQTNIKLPSAKASPLKVALVADIHLGLFVRPWQLERLVHRLNATGADLVLVAGDWTYEPRKDLKSEFAALAKLKMPVYAVLGNHDVEKPGPRLTEPLRQALSSHGVQWLEGRSVNFKSWELVGLDDLWGGSPRRQIRELLSTQSNQRLVLTHQPDTLALVPLGTMSLGMAGHTHGGQVWLPFITPLVLRQTQRALWYNGLYHAGSSKIMVTQGTGMIGLPFRFFVPPTIDLLFLDSR